MQQKLVLRKRKVVKESVSCFNCLHDFEQAYLLQTLNLVTRDGHVMCCMECDWMMQMACLATTL